MEYNQLHINSLVELYWKLVTSIEEENTLRELCKTSNEFKKEFPDLVAINNKWIAKYEDRIELLTELTELTAVKTVS